MTEKEKMLKGMIYDPFDEEIERARTKAHILSEKFNRLLETQTKKRNKILDELLPNMGESVFIQGPVRFDYGINTYIGDYTYANFNFTVLDICPVTIGKNVFFGPNVSLLTPVHPFCAEDRNGYFKNGVLTTKEYGRPIVIEDNCWLAGNVTVCGGVTIGEGSVIGAGSVVTRDIPKNSFAVGNPCRVKRQITSKDSLKSHPELFE